MYDNARPQWTMTVTVYHGPQFGHSVELATETRGRPDRTTHDSLGTWRGTGVPYEVLKMIRALIDSVVVEHLTHRYGIADTLPGWEAEPEPF